MVLASFFQMIKPKKKFFQTICFFQRELKMVSADAATDTSAHGGASSSGEGSSWRGLSGRGRSFHSAALSELVQCLASGATTDTAPQLHRLLTHLPQTPPQGTLHQALTETPKRGKVHRGKTERERNRERE